MCWSMCKRGIQAQLHLGISLLLPCSRQIFLEPRELSLCACNFLPSADHCLLVVRNFLVHRGHHTFSTSRRRACFLMLLDAVRAICSGLVLLSAGLAIFAAALAHCCANHHLTPCHCLLAPLACQLTHAGLAEAAFAVAASDPLILFHIEAVATLVAVVPLSTAALSAVAAIPTEHRCCCFPTSHGTCRPTSQEVKSSQVKSQISTTDRTHEVKSSHVRPPTIPST